MCGGCARVSRVVAATPISISPATAANSPKMVGVAKSTGSFGISCAGVSKHRAAAGVGAACRSPSSRPLSSASRATSSPSWGAASTRIRTARAAKVSLRRCRRWRKTRGSSGFTRLCSKRWTKRSPPPAGDAPAVHRLGRRSASNASPPKRTSATFTSRWRKARAHDCASRNCTANCWRRSRRRNGRPAFSRILKLPSNNAGSVQRPPTALPMPKPSLTAFRGYSRNATATSTLSKPQERRSPNVNPPAEKPKPLPKLWRPGSRPRGKACAAWRPAPASSNAGCERRRRRIVS